MKKILLSLFLSVFVSIGAWADDYTLSTDTWLNSVPAETENAVYITLNTSGKLSDAISAAKTTYPNYQQVHIHTADGVTLSPEDIAALSSLEYETIDLQGVSCNNENAFTFSNTTVKNLILPNGWDKSNVANCAKAVGSQLGSALSQGSYKDGAVGTALVAYVNQGNTLYDAVNRTFTDGDGNNGTIDHRNYYLGSPMTQNNMRKSNLKSLSVSGNPVARDYSGEGSGIYYTEDGHFQFDQEPNENSWKRNYGVNDTEANCPGDVGSRKLVGPRTDGAMIGANLVELDLKDALISDAYCNDLTLSWSGVLGTNTKYIYIPECEQLTILPADFIAGINSVTEICIPSNIEVIKTRAFAASVDHIWTTKGKNDIDNTTWDNGLTDGNADPLLDADGNPRTGYTDAEFSLNCSGTYTFSSNLKVIERFAFSNTQPYVSDVYVLAVEAPECHVDAFGPSFYVSYSGYGVTPDASGIITRGSFKNGDYWMTMLHYPRECSTPQIQRYTDPTRVYSIATGLTDGRGAQIYFPMYGEFLAAYLQGTYGYTWRAWDVDTRTNYGDLALVPGIPTNAGWSAGDQAKANTLFTGKEPDATFYDTTLGDNTKPAGLSDYYDVEWEGTKLYPKAEYSETSHPVYVAATETDFENGIKVYTKDGDAYTEATTWNDGETYYKRIQTQVVDENGNPSFESCEKGHYVKDFRYEEDPEGTFVRTQTGVEYKTTTTSVEGVTTYYSDNQGAVATPKVGNEFYKGVEEANYTEVDKNNDVIGSKDVYFVKDENGSFVESSLEFSTPLYYKTGVKITKKEKTWFIKQGVTAYYSLENGEYVEVFPNLTGPSGASCAYKDANGYHITSTYVKGESEWYVTWDNGQNWTAASDQMQISFGAEYYYDGTEEVDEYKSTSVYLPTVSDYYAADGDVNPVTLSWWNHIKQITYYYLNGTHIVYYDASNSEYDPSTTYYTDNTGSTEAETVNFDGTYFYTVNTYDYTEAEEGAEGTRYAKIEYYREAEEGETGDRYCPVMQDVEFFDIVNYSKDYRGWHQFVLTGYAANTDVPMISYRSYLTDTDWWTLCVPFDLNYNEAMLLLGDPGTKKIPYVSQLLNVVRDEVNSTITLNFSENLMLHKATNTDGNWQVSETEAPSTDKNAQDDEDIVIHQGVPYLIRPNFISGRQFDIYPDLTDYPSANVKEISEDRIVASHNDYPGLFEKLKNAENYSGYTQRNLQRDGIVTVPALVAKGSSEATNGKTVTYNGTEYPVSAEWDYSFVGAFYNNMIPANSYYLGYDPDKKKATFYLATAEAASIYNAFKWINNTAVICPNLLSSSAAITRSYSLGKGSHSGEVTPAEGTGSSARPAQWKINSLVLDDLGTSTGANGFGMNFGGFMSVNETDAVKPMTVKVNLGGKVFTIDGRYVGDSVSNLSKGVYIQNGKKIVVK